MTETVTGLSEKIITIIDFILATVSSNADAHGAPITSVHWAIYLIHETISTPLE